MKWVFLERLSSLILALISAVPSGDSAQHPRPQRHWEETETETIWRDQYTNCKYGYFVLLPSGVVAHGSHSPAPNHGFVVSLPDVGKTSEASVNEPRFLWVNAEYNMSESRSLRGVANYQLDLHRIGKTAFRVVKRKSTTLGGIAAIGFSSEIGNRNGGVTEDEVIALRSGIVYEIGLRTRQADYDRDRQWFEQVRRGFKMLSLPEGDCSSD